MPTEDDSSLERMRRRLYSSQQQNNAMEYDDLSTHATQVPRGWKQEAPSPMPRPAHKKLPLAIKFLIGAAAFFLVAVAATAYFLFIGGRSVSTDNIDINIDGPITVAGGKTIDLLITVENTNPVAITDTKFSVEFPDGTRSADDVTKEFDRYDESLGTIESGKAIARTVRATLFGEENTVVNIPVTLEYRTVNSNAVFVKKNLDYSVTITSSPVSVSATSVSEISSGQQLTLSVSVRSNATEPLSDLALKAEYPFGFTLASTSIPADNGLFEIGTLKPGQEQKITVVGTLSGENNDQRVFHWTAGSVASSTNGALGVRFAAVQSLVTITRPFFDVTLSLDNDSTGNPIVGAGKEVHGTLKWKNTLAEPILNGNVQVKLSGTAFEPDTVTTNGFYQSSNTTIEFNSDTNDGLRSLAPGDTGVGTFSFKIKSGSALAALRNPSATLTVSASGRRVNESGVSDTLSATLTRSVKIATGLSLSSRAVRTVGPFTNTGPFPPEVGKESTYTVMLTATNDVNSIGGAVVSMTLPSYVRFTGLINPSGTPINFNESTRTVTWTVGDMNASATKTASFQIAITPSASQKDDAPTLVSSQTLTGTDRFTQTTITSTAGALDTELTTDPAYKPSNGSVE